MLRLHPLILNPRASRAHWDIIEALEASDPLAAERAMREHIREMAGRINARLDVPDSGGASRDA